MVEHPTVDSANCCHEEYTKINGKSSFSLMKGYILRKGPVKCFHSDAQLVRYIRVARCIANVDDALATWRLSSSSLFLR